VSGGGGSSSSVTGGSATGGVTNGGTAAGATLGGSRSSGGAGPSGGSNGTSTGGVQSGGASAGALASGGVATTTGGASGGTSASTGGSSNGGISTAGAGGKGSGGVGGAGGQIGSGGGAGAAGGGGAGASHAADAEFCKAQLTSAASQFAAFRGAYTNPMQIPRSAKNGTPRLVAPSDWTSGFVAGSFWYLYEYTKDASFRSAAESFTQALAGQRTRTDTHDVGFVINCSYGNGYRLTQNSAYVSVLTQAAQSLASRFNATVGATRSWDFGSWTYPVIIDNMMNLELLYRGAALGGSASLKTIAVSHAATTLSNHFRADNSSYHLVDYNPSNGKVIKKQTNQGLHDESAWARGQAWGLYGFTMSYRESKDARFLDQATRIAEFYTKSERMPADSVPYFDFDAPIEADVPDLRDASAGAIAASGLLELAGFVPDAAAERYRKFAINALRSLSSSSYRAAPGTNGNFLLMHSVGNYPISDEVDVAINYADYYYLEALTRCAALE
jgi:hypothetical protein